MTKLRIISDLHYTKGINGPEYDKNYKSSGLWKNFGKDFQEPADITLIAGDIAAGINDHKEFLENFFPNQRVIFIDGNHICYFTINDYLRPILSEVKKELAENFPKTHLLWNYLENNWMWIDQNTAIIGSTFYTDYAYCDLTLQEFNDVLKSWDAWSTLYGLPSKYIPITKFTKKVIREESMSEARARLNDFQWGNESRRKHLSPEYYLKLHRKAKKQIKRCYNEILAINPKVNIILMTHHCLSPNCISKRYKKGLMNASYTSDLEKWIDKQFPNIKLVISGHVHNRNDFTFGTRNVRYITNPCGYIEYNEPFQDMKFNPNLIIDTNNL